MRIQLLKLLWLILLLVVTPAMMLLRVMDSLENTIIHLELDSGKESNE